MLGTRPRVLNRVLTSLKIRWGSSTHVLGRVSLPRKKVEIDLKNRFCFEDPGLRVGSTLEEYSSGKHKSSILFGGYYGTQYRVRFYPPFGYSFLYKEYNLTGFDNQKTLLTRVA